MEGVPTWLQDMLADALAEVALLREKHRLDHKAIHLLQRKACMLANAADLGTVKLQDENTTLERKLQGQLVERECQVSVWSQAANGAAYAVFQCSSLRMLKGQACGGRSWLHLQKQSSGGDGVGCCSCSYPARRRTWT